VTGRCWARNGSCDSCAPGSALTNIAELPEYIRRADKLMNIAERIDIVNYLAAHPKAGDVMEGTGGVRVIYYMHSDAMPLYLLTLFAKNERANLTKAERNELGDLVDLLVEIWTT
jgi:hypothetical protein